MSLADIRMMVGMALSAERRWAEVLDHLSAVIADGMAVAVDGAHVDAFAGKLAGGLSAAGRPCARLTAISSADQSGTIVIAHGASLLASRKWDIYLWLRTGNSSPVDADVVIDLNDPGWPVIRHINPELADQNRWYVSESRAFFAARAAGWDAKFGDDIPAYQAAIAEAKIPEGSVIADIGCGTGRALPALVNAAGRDGCVLGIDLTPDMLSCAKAEGRDQGAALILGDACHLPIGDRKVDAVFAAGLLMHLPDPVEGLRELARITRPGGLLIVFHPTGRAALAARHKRTLRPDDPQAEIPLRRNALRTGWRLDRYDDGADRFLAIASRH